MDDITVELAKLHVLSGAEFSRQVERIASRREFHPLEGETDIFIAGGEQRNDFENLLNAAHKAVEHGYRVFILPNPKGIRTADFIFERKGTYRLYDLKTIYGKSSVINRLIESIGQSNNILLNIVTTYSARILAKDIIKYFNSNPNALEVMIFKGNKIIQLKRVSVENKDFIKKFIHRYNI